ncbi:MAG: CRISPR-associated endonuclease Cas2 [Planctomycetes bacterium]|nr:CRISPR-associated endonuclease Cas2 [Planctomycetota bacterium]
MRHLYLVTYDVSDAKRLRKTFKTMKNFGTALQYSVFRCELDRMERVRLITRLHEVLDLNEDRVMLADLGPAEGRAIERVEWLGKAPAEAPADEGARIV